MRFDLLHGCRGKMMSIGFSPLRPLDPLCGENLSNYLANEPFEAKITWYLNG
jgi:hypothetical protein